MAVLSVQFVEFQYIYTFSSITSNISITPKKLRCANVETIPTPSFRPRLPLIGFLSINFLCFRELSINFNSR